jgi:dienelactone hydrolase
MKRILFAGIVAVIINAQFAAAEITEKRIEYKLDSVTLIGFMYSDITNTENLPGVLVFSDWMGVGPFAKERGKQLAALGYRAFVADIYGNGTRAKDQADAAQLATKYKSDRPLMRKRAGAALQALLANTPVDPNKVGAIGFCFGGTVALELARDGAPVAGVVSFHGGLDTPTTLPNNIKGKILALHGADDPYVPQEQLVAFVEEMRKGGVNWEIVAYGGAVHSFTNPDAGTDVSKGAAYNELVAKRAYTAMESFFREVFQG